MSICCATWNIHRCIGRDGRYAPERVIEVLKQLDADVIALQEVETGENYALLTELSRATGMQGLAGMTMLGERGHYGNAVLTRLDVERVQRVDLSVHGREPRGALVLELLAGPRHLLEVVATHLGLRPGERRRQVRRLLEALPSGAEARSQVLMGDFNEWFLWGRPLRWLSARYTPTPARATYPASLPILSLDRIWVRPRHQLLELAPVRNALTRVASDHLPLRAVIAS